MQLFIFTHNIFSNYLMNKKIKIELIYLFVYKKYILMIVNNNDNPFKRYIL